MKIAVGADHAGLPLKEAVINRIGALEHAAVDLGAHDFDADDDYPDFALAVATEVAEGRADRGVVLCGSGVGASIVANKVRGVRAGVCHDTYSARQGVEHDDMNVLCIGSRIIGSALADSVVDAFVTAAFTGEERHARRLEKVKAIEASGGISQ
ncbi:MAG: ribose 5-phosphate isomerase B [Chloroflexi bacterium]|nr:ribose 5-phosphate isomerase B [Chloroflexota bacterium]